jgi:hypothetical protein
LHLSKWLDSHVRGRIIPEVPHGGVQVGEIGPRVVMKMDLRGQRGQFCQPLSQVVHCVAPWTSGLVNFTFGRKKETNKSRNHFNLGGIQNCKTKFVEFDDEAYLTDGMPLPEGTKIIFRDNNSRN